MNLAVLKKDDNRLFDRTEVVVRAEHRGNQTPKRLELREEIAKELKAKPELIVIKAIRNLYGVPHSVVEANVYSKPEKMMECEPKYILIRNGIITKQEAKTGGEEEKGAEDKGKEA